MLNERQQALVNSESRYILGLAPAGSGKTTTIIEKIARITEQRIHPRNILCYTFTRAAGIEMKERAIRRIGEEAEEMFANTFHSFAIKVINENIASVHPHWENHLIEYGKIDFTIYDYFDRDDILKSIIKRLNLKNIKANAVHHFYKYRDKPKMTGVENQEYEILKKEYEVQCLVNIALDIDNLIPLATELMRREEIRLKYDYEYVFVDEYQDTNDIQANFIKALNPKRLIAIGDDSQSIYGFNNAKIEYILNFENMFEGAEIITLDTNYRSTAEIIELAQEILRENVQSRHKEIKTVKTGSIPIMQSHEFSDGENAAIVEEIKRIGGEFQDSAVLCRTNAIASTCAEYLRMSGIPVNLMTSGSDIFKTEYVRKIIKLMQFISNPNDSYAFSQCINFPVTRLKDPEINAIIRRSQISEIDILSCEWDNPFKIKLKSIRANLARLNTIEFYEECLFASDVISEYSKAGLTTRIIILNEVASEIKKWMKKSRDKSPAAFLKWVTIRDIQEKNVDKPNAVTISTCHGAKGLEWENVYIIGVSGGVFPNDRHDTDIEEERRLMHVAITRARENLFISNHNMFRTQWGQMLHCGQSEFYEVLHKKVKELEENHEGNKTDRKS